MSKKKDEQQLGSKLSPGVKLLSVLSGHEEDIFTVAFDSSGQTLASGSRDKTVRLWDTDSGELLRTLEGHEDAVVRVAFDPLGRTLASGSYDNTVRLWNADSGKLLHTMKASSRIFSVAFDPTGQMLAGGGGSKAVNIWDVASGKLFRRLDALTGPEVNSVVFDPTGQVLAVADDSETLSLWEVSSGRLLRTLEGHRANVLTVAFDPTGRTLASGSHDRTVRLWDVATGQPLRTLEGSTNFVDAVGFFAGGQLLVSRDDDGTARLWDCETWEMVGVIPDPKVPGTLLRGLACHPRLPLLALAGYYTDAPSSGRRAIRFWELDFNVLLGKTPGAKPVRKAIHHTTAKIVLVGDHSVGKSGLGYRLAHGEFKEQASTHGQQFWVLPQLGKLREDGTECEAILWDLAGQPDYRLIHALFLDDVDLALVLFDSSDISDPLHGVEFWLKQLKVGQGEAATCEGGMRTCCRTILVGAQSDRGTPTLTLEELEEFCRRRGIGGYVSTSAKEGLGVEELVGRMKELIAWEEKPATTTTVTFKRIKDYVLRLKEERQEGQPVIVTPDELRAQLELTDADWQFTHDEMMTAVGHLENYGYVKKLRTSKNEERVLLSPELLNNLAASFVLEARRNIKGLGSLEEGRLLKGEYRFPELDKLSAAERDILLDSAALLFLEHNVCFRETDPLGGLSYLVFPELINLKKPLLEDERPTEDGVAYTVAGAVENVYASLVVLLGYTQTFTRTNQWQNQARYEVGEQLICGFRQEAERSGELDFVLYFAENVGRPVRTLFQGLFESFLARRNLNVSRFEPVVCPDGHALNRAVVRERLGKGSASAFCPECGKAVALPRSDEPIQLTQVERRKVDEQRWFAERRTRFEQAVFQVMSYVNDQGLKVPECFISYAWGNSEQERWVEKSLAADLQKAGIKVLLDRWENSRIGSNVMRFVERIEGCDYLIVVGTPLYRRKAMNAASARGSVAAAEWDVAGIRMLGAEAGKQTVLPVLLAGDESEAFPALLRGRVYADFRDERAYFTAAFDLILRLYDIPHAHQAVADLRESLRGGPGGYAN